MISLVAANPSSLSQPVALTRVGATGDGFEMMLAALPIGSATPANDSPRASAEPDRIMPDPLAGLAMSAEPGAMRQDHAAGGELLPLPSRPSALLASTALAGATFPASYRPLLSPETTVLPQGTLTPALVEPSVGSKIPKVTALPGGSRVTITPPPRFAQDAFRPLAASPAEANPISPANLDLDAPDEPAEGDAIGIAPATIAVEPTPSPDKLAPVSVSVVLAPAAALPSGCGDDAFPVSVTGPAPAAQRAPARAMRPADGDVAPSRTIEPTRTSRDAMAAPLAAVVDRLMPAALDFVRDTARVQPDSTPRIATRDASTGARSSIPVADAAQAEPMSPPSLTFSPDFSLKSGTTAALPIERTDQMAGLMSDVSNATSVAPDSAGSRAELSTARMVDPPRPLAFHVAIPEARPGQTPAATIVATPPTMDAPRSPSRRGAAIGGEAAVALGAVSLPTESRTPIVADAATLDTRRSDWLQTMVDRIDHLRDAHDGEVRESRIRLAPDRLGTVEIAVRDAGDAIHVHFRAETDATRTLIADAAPTLAQIAESRGVRIAGTSVGGGAAGHDSHRPPAPEPQQRSTARAALAPSTDPDTESAAETGRIA